MIDKQQDIFKDIYNEDNPLWKLIELDRRENIKSLLVRDLIGLICEKIQMTKDDLMQDTFYQPTESTLTYWILFDQSFAILPIHITIIKQLILTWQEWEKEGFQIVEIQKWNELKDNQQRIVCQIWNLVGENLEKEIRFQQLINDANRKIQDIIKTKKNVRLCIDNYCQDASDKNRYISHLQDLQNQLDRGTVYSAEVPRDIEVLKTLANLLEPVISSRVWQEYLKQNLEYRSKFILLIISNSVFNCYLTFRTSKQL